MFAMIEDGKVLILMGIDREHIGCVHNAVGDLGLHCLHCPSAPFRETLAIWHAFREKGHSDIA